MTPFRKGGLPLLDEVGSVIGDGACRWFCTMGRTASKKRKLEGAQWRRSSDAKVRGLRLKGEVPEVMARNLVAHWQAPLQTHGPSDA